MERKRKRDHDFSITAFQVVQEATSEGETTLDHIETELINGKNPHAVALGRLGGLKGGKARAEKLTPEQRRKIARQAAQSRWAK